MLSLAQIFGSGSKSIEPTVTIDDVLADFRDKRAEDMATLADRAGRSGVRIAEAEKERDQWRSYARQLERLCLAKGIDLPVAPDETSIDK